MRMRITRRWSGFLATVVLLLWLPASAVPAYGASGPASYALIFGTVWGPGARPLYGVHIRVRRAGEKRFRWEAYSDHRGEFGIRVPAGQADYVLIPDVKRQKAKPAPETKIHVESDERLDIGVHLDEE